MWRSRRSRCCPTSRGGSDAGTALPAALLLLACLVGVTGWLTGHVRVDGDIARTLEDEREAARVAGAAAQVVALSLAQVPDWRQIDALVVPVPCAPAPGAIASLDVAAEGLVIQAEEQEGSRWGVDTPRWAHVWTCHAAGVLGHWPPAGVAPAVAVWVADDVEGDGRPDRDTNERLRVMAVAMGRGAARSVAVATIGRTGVGAPVTLLAWRPGPPG